MALVAVSVWTRSPSIVAIRRFSPPLCARRHRSCKGVGALDVCGGICCRLDVMPAMIHPVSAVSRLRPSDATSRHAHRGSPHQHDGCRSFWVRRRPWTARAAACHPGNHPVPSDFRGCTSGARGALVTTLLLIPAMSFRIATLWLQGTIRTNLLPPLWFVGLHDMMSGHIWAQLPRPELPARVAVSERTFESIYQSHRPLLRQLGVAGGGAFLARVGRFSRRVPLEQPTASASPDFTDGTTRSSERHLRRDRAEACRTAAARSSGLFLHHARPSLAAFTTAFRLGSRSRSPSL